MQQFCDIFGKKGDACHITLGDNPAGHSFVLRDLVLIEFSGHAPPAPPHPFQLGAGGSKFQKSLLGASEILILVEGGILLGGKFVGGGGRGSRNFEVKIKLHNTSIKNIFGITNLIYFRGI